MRPMTQIGDEVREMTDAEYKAYLAHQEEIKNKEIASRLEVENSWNSKVSAYKKLGLTAEEIEAIAPTPLWLKPSGTLD